MIGPRSALYVMDLVRFRQMAAGVRLTLTLNLPVSSHSLRRISCAVIISSSRPVLIR